jgi:tRNA pseudouridine38-40 synthase
VRGPATVRLVVAYDGRGYSGFAPNPGVRTVGGTLAAAIERVLGHAVELSCAGRTDAGVHAWGQVVSFPAPAATIDLARLGQRVNKLCGPAVVVREAALAPPGFDARRSARSRTYHYTVLNRPVPDPFLAAVAWHVAHPLDLAAMRLGADPFVGEHDFSSFCRRPADREEGREVALVRRVRRTRWDVVGEDLLRFEIEADAFCHQMVRSIVGLLVDVGRGRRRAGEVAAVLRARDRRAASPLAPPHGLCLWEVTYPPEAL